MEIKADKNLIAFCGLYCGGCPQYLKEKCPGCVKNEKATWCQIRVCCLQNKYTSCAECKSYADINKCKKFNNIVSKIFAFIFRSNRKACIEKIKLIGPEKFAAEMAKIKKHSIKS
jgi:hypothetical protein